MQVPGVSAEGTVAISTVVVMIEASLWPLKFRDSRPYDRAAIDVGRFRSPLVEVVDRQADAE